MSDYYGDFAPEWPTIELTIIRTTFLESGISDGEYGPDAETTTETEIYAVDDAIDAIRNLGCTTDEGAHWFYSPDGSIITDYVTGRREEVSVHLPDATPASVRQAISDGVTA